MVRGGVHFSLGGKFVDDLWQVISQEARRLSGIYSHFCRQHFDLLRTKRVLNLIAGDRLVLTHAHRRLECVALATLCKFVGETLQTTALREEANEELMS
jgi:hypothetical protein